MKRIKWLSLLIIALLFLACPSADKAKSNTSSAKDFTLTSIDNEEITLSSLQGKVVLIDFWATWCPPCRSSIPVFIKLYNKYNDRGFVVLGISREDKSTLLGYRDEHQIPYPILIDNKNVAADYGVRAIPNIFILDKKGKIRKTQVGFSPQLEAQFDAFIDSLLKE